MKIAGQTKARELMRRHSFFDLFSRRLRGLIGAACAVGSISFASILASPVDVAAKSKTVSYKQMRQVVLSAAPEKLRLIGAHIVVGYDVAWQLTPFLERGAIGGIYITKRNSRRRTIAQIKKEISGFRDLASGNTERPLWITADQEGGLVSRLTPPLPRQSSLQGVVLGASSVSERDKAVREFATLNAEGLANIGVNINFAPVVDLSPIRTMKRDRYTRLNQRAMSRDPGIVTFAAATYCETLARFDVLCTLKHFPGLSRVRVDTHLAGAKLNSKRDDVEGQDWVPFREVTEAAPAALMIGHPHVAVLDPDNPASTSKGVINDLVRDEWGFDGLIITDDLDMGAIKKRRGGMSRAAIDALNAGADLVLFTFDPSRIIPVYYALLKAYDDGSLDKAKLELSRARLDKIAKQLHTRGKGFQEASDHQREPDAQN